MRKNNIEFKLSQIIGSLALSGVAVSDEMKETARKILNKEISVETALDDIRSRHSKNK